MKLIKTITDKDVLGMDGLSSVKPRLTARAILKNESNQYAVMHSSEFELYSLPGGGIEENEAIVEALKREVFEETGCLCDDIQPLGYIEENRAHQDYTAISYYFVVSTSNLQLHPSLTEDERKHGTTVGWYSLKDAYEHIANACHATTQRKFLQARDVAAFDAYKKMLV